LLARDAAITAVLEKNGVQQLRHRFGPFLAHYTAIPHVCLVLTHACLVSHSRGVVCVYALLMSSAHTDRALHYCSNLMRLCFYSHSLALAISALRLRLCLPLPLPRTLPLPLTLPLPCTLPRTLLRSTRTMSATWSTTGSTSHGTTATTLAAPSPTPPGKPGKGRGWWLGLTAFTITAAAIHTERRESARVESSK